jgi:hypothetical protein
MSAIPADIAPESLRDLAAALVARAAAAEKAHRSAVFELDAAAIESLADILAAGSRPTIGWWRRHGRRPDA